MANNKEIITATQKLTKCDKNGYKSACKVDYKLLGEVEGDTDYIQSMIPYLDEGVFIILNKHNYEPTNKTKTQH